ncbi:MAG: alpha/beta hydrolase [Pseudomonadota bacterium]
METVKTPAWFDRAIANKPTSHKVDVEDCPIHYLHWGERDKPGVLLVHGNGAHAHWWDFVAPFLLDHYQVAALDLSGMGDSGHRDWYAAETYGKELIGVCNDAGFGSDTVIVGHSFGGFISIQAGLHYAAQLSGVVLVDSPVRPPDYEWERDPRRSPIRAKRTYDDFEAAVGRFRLMPPQPCENDYIVDYIGRHSLMQISDGWQWKFDDQRLNRTDTRLHNRGEALSALKCRVGVIYGEDSELFTQEITDYMFQVLDSNVPFVAIPEAHHHIMLDQPLAFVSALRAVLAEWRHSRPLRQV